MDPRLLAYYNQELEHLRVVGAEFAKEFPKIAGRLGMAGIEVADPYVERLLEGFAFLSARVRLKLDAEFPRFTQHLLEMVYPHYLAPTPAMLIAQLYPNLNETNLAQGYLIPRGSSLRSAASGEMSACQFSTAHDVTLWPIEIVDASYFSSPGELPLSMLPKGQRFRSALRLRLRSTAGLQFDQLQLDRLQLYLAGTEQIAFKVYELCLSAGIGALVAAGARAWHEYLPPARLRPIGFADSEALLPVTLRSFQGYRLLQEYFAFPDRFRFVEIGGLRGALQRAKGDQLELVLMFNQSDPALESLIDASHFSLFCTPAINLFAKRADRIHINDSTHEHHVVPDRTRPLDFEVYEVRRVTGYGVGAESEQQFLPFYALAEHSADDSQAYFSLRREPRMLSQAQKRRGTRSSYIGSEVFISLVDPRAAPYRGDLRQLALETLCTNRDLPLQMPVGAGKTDFVLDSSAPVEAIKCCQGPSKPYTVLAEGALAWRLISHLSLNYLSVHGSNAEQAALALRELLDVYANATDPVERSQAAKQIESLRLVETRAVTRRLPMPGPITFGRGLEVRLTVDEVAFQGASAFLFGAVLERFLRRYVSINSFTETVLRSNQRGEIMRWSTQCGERPIL